MASIDTIADRSAGSTVAGKAYFETSTNKFIVYNGSSWVDIDSDGTGAVAFENRWGASFGGSDDSFAFTGSTDIQLDQTYTVCSWFKINSTSAAPRGLITWGEAALGKGRGLYFNGSKVGSFGYGGGYNVDSSTDISTGVWYHAAATYDGTTLKLYVNGTLDTSHTVSLNSFTYSMTHIGELYYSQTTADRHFDGYLDDLALFNTVLSAADITKIYNGTAPNGKPTDLTLAASYDTDRTANLKGYWRMGDDSNDSPSSNPSSNNISTITDSSGNGNDATQATASSQPTFSALEQSTSSISFDGSNDYFTTTLGSQVFSGDFTVSSWIKPTRAGSNTILFHLGSSNAYNDPGFRIYQQSGGFSFWDGFNSAYTNIFGVVGSESINSWQNLIVTRSGSAMTFYVDGVSVGTGTNSRAYTNTDFATAYPQHTLYQGLIDEVAIFNTALSASNIASLAGSRGAHIKDDLSLNPLVYYRMGEDDGLTDGQTGISQITDASGNGNHATQATAVNQPTASVNPIIYV